MKITYADIPLARGEYANEEPTGLRIETKHTIQTLRFLRAGSVKNTNRGNLETSVRFTVARRHNSEAEAIRFALTHAQQLRSSEQQLLRIDAENHGTRASFSLTSAAPESVQCEASGLVTTCAYEFICGVAETVTN